MRKYWARRGRLSRMLAGVFIIPHSLSSTHCRIACYRNPSDCRDRSALSHFRFPKRLSEASFMSDTLMSS